MTWKVHLSNTLRGIQSSSFKTSRNSALLSNHYSTHIRIISFTTARTFLTYFSPTDYLLIPPVQDAGLASSVSDQVYQADARLSAEASRALGRIIGSDVKVCAHRPVSRQYCPCRFQIAEATPIASASESKSKPMRPGLKPKVATQEKALTRTGSKFKSTESVGESSKEHAETLPSQMPKLTGKLNWGKVKPGPSRESSKETVEDPQDEEELKLASPKDVPPGARLARGGMSGSSLQGEQARVE